MTTSREWQLIALNTMYANLQRAHMFDRSTHLITGTAEDEARSAVLRGWMDAVANAFQAALVEEEVNAQTQQALLQHRPLTISLINQAKIAVGTAAEGEPTEEARGYIREHVAVAERDKGRMRLQVGAIPVMLAGQEPRG